jgi:CBS domain-containing protein
MRNKNVSSLIVVDDNKPVGIIIERDSVEKLYVNDTSGGEQLIKDLMSFPLVTADARLSVEIAADKMIQNKINNKMIRHSLVVQDDDIKKPLSIITSTDFVTYLKSCIIQMD